MFFGQGVQCENKPYIRLLRYFLTCSSLCHLIHTNTLALVFCLFSVLSCVCMLVSVLIPTPSSYLVSQTTSNTNSRINKISIIIDIKIITNTINIANNIISKLSYSYHQYHINTESELTKDFSQDKRRGRRVHRRQWVGHRS